MCYIHEVGSAQAKRKEKKEGNGNYIGLNQKGQWHIQKDEKSSAELEYSI